MYSKSLTTKTKLLLVLFAFSFKVQAMDQLKENHFTKVPSKKLSTVYFLILFVHQKPFKKLVKIGMYLNRLIGSLIVY